MWLVIFGLLGSTSLNAQSASIVYISDGTSQLRRCFVRKHDAMARGNNTVGDDLYQHVELGPNKPIHMLSEGQFISETLNQTPGGNATSYVHDYWTFGSTDSTISGLWYVPCVIATYFALYPNMRYYYNQGNY